MCARYPEFLPWCASARVEEVSPTERLAAVKAAKGALRMQFTTRNTLRPDAEILMQLAEGRFSRLDRPLALRRRSGERGSRVLFRVRFRVQEPADGRGVQSHVRSRSAIPSSTRSCCAHKAFTADRRSWTARGRERDPLHRRGRLRAAASGPWSNRFAWLAGDASPMRWPWPRRDPDFSGIDVIGSRGRDIRRAGAPGTGFCMRGSRGALSRRWQPIRRQRAAPSQACSAPDPPNAGRAA